jgi:hypothetical protein
MIDVIINYFIKQLHFCKKGRFTYFLQKVDFLFHFFVEFAEPVDFIQFRESNEELLTQTYFFMESNFKLVDAWFAHLRRGVWKTVEKGKVRIAGNFLLLP